MIIRKKIETKNLPEAAKAKWSAESLDEGFVPFPKRLLRCLPRIFDGKHALEDLAVVLAVVDYRRPNLARPPSMEFLAFVAGMDMDGFEARVDELTKKGWLTRSGPNEAVTIEIDGLLEKIVKETEGE